MHQRRVILSLLAAVIIVSGCTGGGGNQEADDQGNTAISVQNLQVEPAEIFAGSNTRIRMSFENVGELPARIQLGENGENVLTNHCPDIFDVKSFTASSSNVSNTFEDRPYILDNGYQMRLTWNLEQSSDNVPLNGYRCNLRFKVPFNYSVDAFQQIQIKRNSEVEGSDELFSKSSAGPMKLEIESIGSSSPEGAPTFLENDSPEVLVQLENKEPEEGAYSGTMELGMPTIEASGVEFGNDTHEMECPRVGDVEATLQLYQSQSKIFRCPITWELNAPSKRAEISASADYAFIKDAGTREVQVRYRGE